MGKLCDTKQIVKDYPSLKFNDQTYNIPNLYCIEQGQEIDLDFAHDYIKQQLEVIRTFGQARINGIPTQNEIASLDKVNGDTMSQFDNIPKEWYNNIISLLDSYDNALPTQQRPSKVSLNGDNNKDEITSDKFKRLIDYLNHMKLSHNACDSCIDAQGGGCWLNLGCCSETGDGP